MTPEQEIAQLKQWVADLQSGMYVNCIYCGHRYPPGTPVVRATVLYEHIKTCPKHPLAKALDEMATLKSRQCRTCCTWQRYPMHTSVAQRFGACNLRWREDYERSADAWVDTREDFYCAAWEKGEVRNGDPV